VQAAFGIRTNRFRNLAKFRDPDQITDPVTELEKLVPGYAKVSGARELGRRLSRNGNFSTSFRVFLSGIDHLIATLQDRSKHESN
jgi:hypothetical protein